MESSNLYLVFFLLLPPLLFLILFSWAYKAISLPRGQFGWPLIGETIQFLSAAKTHALDSFILDRMRLHNPFVFKTSLLGSPTAVLCGSPGNKFLFSNENVLVHGSWPASVKKLLPNSLMAKAGDDYSRIRRVFSAFFQPDALQRYVGRMDALTKAHLRDEWEGKEEITVLPMAKAYTFSLGCAIFASAEQGGRTAPLAKHFKVVVDGCIQLPVAAPGTKFRRACRAADASRKEVKKIVEERKAALAQGRALAEQDMVLHLITAGDGDGDGRMLSEKEVLDNVLVLLLGAEDTTACALTFLMKILAEMPDVYSEVVREQTEIADSKAPGELLTWEDLKRMNYSWNVAREVLRIWSPVQGGFREAIADINYAGFDVPRGWKLYWSTATTHRNSAYFPEPGKFDPSRHDGDGPAPFSFVPFGGGPRMCPGREYARIEILVFLHNVVRKFKWELVIPNEKVTIGAVPAPENGLPIRLRPVKYN